MSYNGIVPEPPTKSREGSTTSSNPRIHQFVDARGDSLISAPVPAKIRVNTAGSVLNGQDEGWLATTDSGEAPNRGILAALREKDGTVDQGSAKVFPGPDDEVDEEAFPGERGGRESSNTRSSSRSSGFGLKSIGEETDSETGGDGQASSDISYYPEHRLVAVHQLSKTRWKRAFPFKYPKKIKKYVTKDDYLGFMKNVNDVMDFQGLIQQVVSVCFLIVVLTILIVFMLVPGLTVVIVAETVNQWIHIALIPVLLWPAIVMSVVLFVWVIVSVVMMIVEDIMILRYMRKKAQEMNNYYIATHWFVVWEYEKTCGIKNFTRRSISIFIGLDDVYLSKQRHMLGDPFTPPESPVGSDVPENFGMLNIASAGATEEEDIERVGVDENPVQQEVSNIPRSEVQGEFSFAQNSVEHYDMDGEYIETTLLPDEPSSALVGDTVNFGVTDFMNTGNFGSDPFKDIALSSDPRLLVGSEAQPLTFSPPTENVQATKWTPEDPNIKADEQV